MLKDEVVRRFNLNCLRQDISGSHRPPKPNSSFFTQSSACSSATFACTDLVPSTRSLNSLCLHSLQV